jgi:hypothetical protein
MTRGEGAPYPLFDERSVSQHSLPFRVLPGWLAEFQAFGFTAEPRRIEPDQAYTRPAACLWRVLYKAAPLPDYPEYLCGPGIMDLSQHQAEVLDEGAIEVNGCQWSLTACRNLALLDLPGNYRLVLNDPAEAGQVRIYMRAYPKTDFNRNSALYFGG